MRIDAIHDCYTRTILLDNHRAWSKHLDDLQDRPIKLRRLASDGINPRRASPLVQVLPGMLSVDLNAGIIENNDAAVVGLSRCNTDALCRVHADVEMISLAHIRPYPLLALRRHVTRCDVRTGERRITQRGIDQLELLHRLRLRETQALCQPVSPRGIVDNIFEVLADPRSLDGAHVASGPLKPALVVIAHCIMRYQRDHVRLARMTYYGAIELGVILRILVDRAQLNHITYS